jgi:hypothetical protein
MNDRHEEHHITLSGLVSWAAAIYLLVTAILWLAVRSPVWLIKLVVYGICTVLTAAVIYGYAKAIIEGTL